MISVCELKMLFDVLQYRFKEIERDYKKKTDKV